MTNFKCTRCHYHQWRCLAWWGPSKPGPSVRSCVLCRLGQSDPFNFRVKMKNHSLPVCCSTVYCFILPKSLIILVNRHVLDELILTDFFLHVFQWRAKQIDAMTYSNSKYVEADFADFSLFPENFSQEIFNKIDFLNESQIK